MMDNSIKLESDSINSDNNIPENISENDFFKNLLDSKTERELQALRLWLFNENVRIDSEKKKLQELQNRFLKDQQNFQNEVETFRHCMNSSQKKLSQDELFFEKKMQILKRGFEELDADRKEFEKERETFRMEKNNKQDRKVRSIQKSSSELLFAGVHNPLALKKRYRDLLKIYHPDNIAGDDSVVLYINQEYERLSKEM